jgi:hypothetical protein
MSGRPKKLNLKKLKSKNRNPNTEEIQSFVEANTRLDKKISLIILVVLLILLVLVGCAYAFTRTPPLLTVRQDGGFEGDVIIANVANNIELQELAEEKVFSVNTDIPSDPSSEKKTPTLTPVNVLGTKDDKKEEKSKDEKKDIKSRLSITPKIELTKAAKLDTELCLKSNLVIINGKTVCVISRSTPTPTPTPQKGIINIVPDLVNSLFR